jgi:acetyl-CoA carboxylase biotin carboxyl carrier protein
MKKPIKRAPTARAAKSVETSGGLPISEAAVRKLAKVMKETGLSEISWSDGRVQVKLASQGGGWAVYPPPGESHFSSPAPTAPGGGAAPSGHDQASHPGAVKSPMVGTAYIAAEPGAAPFVREGDAVKQGQTVLIVEAMKTMNPIPAPKSGRVVRVIVEDKQPVEFGQVLMIIE